MTLPKKIFSFLALALAFPSLALADATADAQKNLAPFEKIFGPLKDPRLVMVGIINVFLGVLGIVFVVLIIYAGYLWMTSAGSEEKTRKAKNILTNSAIGLAIILSAWAITRFVLCGLVSSSAGTGFWECAL